MKTRRSTWPAIAVLILVAPVVALAQVGVSEDDDSERWQSTLAPMFIWGVGIDGQVGAGPVDAPLDITFKDALQNLGAVFTFHYEGRKGRFGLLAEYSYVSLKPESALPNGAPLAIDFKTHLLELGPIFRVNRANPYFEILGGLRYIDVEVEPDTPLPLEVQNSWWDGFVGGRLIAEMGERWTGWVRADVGAGGSDLVWNASLGVDFRFKRWGSIMGGYRWLDYDYVSGEGIDRFAFDARMQGILGALVLHF